MIVTFDCPFLHARRNFAVCVDHAQAAAILFALGLYSADLKGEAAGGDLLRAIATLDAAAEALLWTGRGEDAIAIVARLRALAIEARDAQAAVQWS